MVRSVENLSIATARIGIANISIMTPLSLSEQKRGINLARLDDGSWKNDSKVWYMVVKNESGELELKSFNSLIKVRAV